MARRRHAIFNSFIQQKIFQIIRTCPRYWPYKRLDGVGVDQGQLARRLPPTPGSIVSDFGRCGVAGDWPNYPEGIAGGRELTAQK
jgi:hypothetical protein